ncbi:MAG: 3-carboxy-cis,cis-muconate cycloisomerase [Pseudooceanicola sp.]|jgi:3-carboxy-cis,cis-muconate cycloisomerase|nr:3-carboxy-cis,cis-muconate cycloisomerase [Pseudooceanicola sp.]
MDSIGAGIIAGTTGYRRATEAFSETATLEAYLKFERALAEVQGALGIIPKGSADKLVALCQLEAIDRAALRLGVARVGYAIVPLVSQLADKAGPDGQWLHFGTTSQDVMDTALVLQIQTLRGPLVDALNRVRARLGDLADEHRNSAMAGRSKLQHAAPVSFGYRAAVWLDQVARCGDRFVAALDEVAVVQFGGSVGTLSSLGDDGIRTRAGLARQLGLGEPEITWHVTRDRLSNLVFQIASVLGALAKIADDIIFQMATEVAELREPFADGRGSSSTMPQKRNPVMSEAVIEAARQARVLPGQMLDAMVQGQDRGIGHSYIETRAIAEGMRLLFGAAELMGEILDGLEVDSARMRQNLDVSNGLIHAEAAMFALSEGHGRIAAHHLLHQLCHEAMTTGRPLPALLAERGYHLPAEVFDAGMSQAARDDMIDRVLVRATVPGPSVTGPPSG